MFEQGERQKKRVGLVAMVVAPAPAVEGQRPSNDCRPCHPATRFAAPNKCALFPKDWPR